MEKIRKAVVTGANGFIGSTLCQVLNDEGVKIFAIVKDKNVRAQKLEHLSNVSVIYCEMDKIEDLSELVKDKDIDICIHLAWAGSFGDLRGDYLLQLKNVDYAMRMVRVMAQMGVGRFVGAGTLAEKDVLNYHATDGATPNAVSIYGIAKIAAHFMTKVECTRLGIEHIWCYLSNTYGVGNSTTNFINMASILMLEGKKAEFTSGEQMYDFMYITDTARAIYAAAERGKNNTAYYLGSGEQRKLKEYIGIIRDMIDSEIPLHLGAIPFHGVALPEENYDATKLFEDTGFRTEVSFRNGMKQTVEWLKEQRNHSDAKI